MAEGEREAVVLRWSKNSDHCVNCLTEDRRHAARGYCTKCYRILRRIEVTREWMHDCERPPAGFPFLRVPRDPAAFERVKSGIVRQLEGHLARLATRRQMVADRTVEGISIEFLLRDIAVMAGAKESSVCTSVANIMNDDFTPEQKATIYELLLDIDESIPRRMINVGRLHRECDV